MITVLFFILVSVTIVQYIYQSILLPTIRQHLRFKMFALRDKLRHYAYDEVISSNSRVYKILQDRINITVDYLYLVDLKVVFDVNKFLKKNQTISKRVEKNRRLIKSSELVEVREIDDELNKLLFLTMIYNSASFFVWSVLLMLLLLAILHTGKTLWSTAKDLVFRIPCVPEREVIKFAPCL